jgi:hypothetical protein
MASALCCNRTSEEVPSEPSAIASKPRSINDLPDEILLKILSYFGPEELCVNIAEVCKKWNSLSRDVTIWKKACFKCYHKLRIERVVQVRCAVMLGFRSNQFVKSALLNVLKNRFLNCKENLGIWT